jgi:hypothetical protein
MGNAAMLINGECGALLNSEENHYTQMSTLTSVFIHSDPWAVLEFIETLPGLLAEEPCWDVIRCEASNPWIEVQVDIEEVGESARKMSERLKGHVVVGLACQSVVDASGYWQYRDGQEERVLVCGMCEQCTWEEVRGNPQAWEEAVFFADWDEEKGAKEIVEGETEPAFTSAEIRQIGTRLGLPGFESERESFGWAKEIRR